MGLQAAQEESGIELVGGDTCNTLGPLTITVTAIGMLPQGEAVLRRGAMAATASMSAAPSAMPRSG